MGTMKQEWSSSYLFGSNAEFIEELYDAYLADANSVDEKWRKYFTGLIQESKSNARDVIQGVIRDKFAYLTSHQQFSINGASSTPVIADADLQSRVWQLVRAYRSLGMTYADLDPLKAHLRVRPAELDMANYNLQSALTSDTKFYVDLDINHSQQLPLADLVKHFDAVYCASVGFEFSHVLDIQERTWLENYAETKYLNYQLDAADKIHILERLVESNTFERYLHTKYVGQKRFSLEGGESLMPALDRLINNSIQHGVQELYIAMAHRGRLNCLVNIAGKSPQKIFDEFEAKYTLDDFVTSGDVKYHKGYKCNYVTDSGSVKVILANNPSHLESINPVLTGMVRARQDKVENPESILGVIIHGDSALIGLGTNQGVFSLAKTRGYGVHGTIHIVINNQIGFTTSDDRDTRSSRYCTDIAKMVEMPIMHVNADDVENLMFVIDFALEYRRKYRKDIMIDLVCFRRYGHNEADDPTLTQPYMYRLIKDHPGIHALYTNKLLAANITTEAYVSKFTDDFRLSLTNGVHPRANMMQPISWYDGFDIGPVLKAQIGDKVSTLINTTTIQQITNTVTTLPRQDYVLHPTVARLLEARKSMGAGDAPIDFGMAETLAYGSLLQQGITVRLTGEDSGRGTFTHRQAVWHDYAQNDPHADCDSYVALKNLENNSKLHLYNSVLNEECVMGFEYGYSISNLRDLVIWEAQFGDFANGAQVIIDQYITSAEAKWGTVSNLVLLLPHGYDGMGPEHSSARVERYLQMCADNNVQIVIPSTAAQMFHILRHHALTNWIKPLIILMSKRLLRYKDAMSPLSHFTNGSFNEVIGDDTPTVGGVERVIVCCGQVYYDLYQERSTRKLEKQVAIIRLERLYPFPLETLKACLNKFTKARKFVWAQEEPHNQGAWLQIRDGLDASVSARGIGFVSVTRPAAAVTACGMSTLHTKELKDLLDAAFS